MSKARTQYLTVDEIEYTALTLARKTMEWDEPIPDFSTRFPDVLERSLAAPQQTFRGELYSGLVKKAAILFYLLVKNHPFQNGNKRIAVTALLIFLIKNGKWLKLDNQQLYNFAKWVAESDPGVMDAVVQAIEKKLHDSLVKLPHFRIKYPK